MMVDGTNKDFFKITMYIERQSLFPRIWTSLKMIFGKYPDQEIRLNRDQVTQIMDGMQNWHWENLSVNADEFD